MRLFESQKIYRIKFMMGLKLKDRVGKWFTNQGEK